MEAYGMNEQKIKEVMSNSVLLPLVADYVSAGRMVSLPLRGFSMRPYLEDNRDVALLSAVPETLRRGDVILARLVWRDDFALHRITSIEGDTIVMCGDGNHTPEVIRRSDVMAIAVGFYRNGSRKLDRVDTVKYRLYWRLWLFLKPVRRWLLLVWRLYHYPADTLGVIKRRMLHLKNK